MSDFIALMAPSFAACLILTGIHTYLGLHVIKRGVIFVDLAMAQVAALGSTVGYLLGFGLHSTTGYVTALLMTAVAAGVLAFTHSKETDVPQEAYIGIVYAVAAAAVILILSKVPEGGEELKSLLTGHLLFVNWHEIFKVLTIYSLMGMIHWKIRKPLLLISSNYSRSHVLELNTRLWDFVFYLTFGIVVTSSVELSGVLLVFCFLIVPSVCGALYATRTTSRLFIGWSVGFAASVLGILVSYYFDLPTGASIVCIFGGFVLLALLCRSRFVKT